MAKSSEVVEPIAPTVKMSATKTFKLLSGVECEIRKIGTSHQGILTEQGIDPSDAFDTVLADCIVRVGSNTNITKQFIEKMPVMDKKIALIQLRLFSFLFNPILIVEYEFLSSKKGTKGKKLIEKVEVDVEKCTISSPYKVFGIDGKLVDASYREYDEIKRDFITVLPNGLKILYTLKDGVFENRASSIKKKNLDINTELILSCRKLVVMGDKKQELPVEINIKRDLDDLESSIALIDFIHSIEATCNTMVDFEHPEADLLPQNEKIVTIDFTRAISFLFHSRLR